MGLNEITMEMRGMKRKAIIQYFSEIKEISGNDYFFGNKDWSVRVEEEMSIRLGSIELPTTKVVFLGDDKVLKKVIDKFRLKFLSAGG